MEHVYSEVRVESFKCNASAPNFTFNKSLSFPSPIPVAARSKALVYDRSPSGLLGLNPAGSMDVSFLKMCVHLEVSAMGRSLIQRNLTEWCVCVLRSVTRCNNKSSTPKMSRQKEVRLKKKSFLINIAPSVTKRHTSALYCYRHSY